MTNPDRATVEQRLDMLERTLGRAWAGEETGVAMSDELTTHNPIRSFGPPVASARCAGCTQT